MTLDPEAWRALATDYLFRTLWALIVVIVAMVLARGAHRTSQRVLARRRADPNVTVLLGNLSQLTVFLVGALVVLAIYTRESFGWILTSASVLGLVIGLSLQDILRNFFAGVYVLVERPFKIGDTIEVTGYSGVVAEISFRTTQLRTDDGREVIVPNANLMISPVVNLTRYPTRSVRLVVSVPAAQVSPELPEQIRSALAGSEEIADDPAPRVLLRGVAGWSAQYDVVIWGRDPQRAAAAAVALIRGQGADREVQLAPA